MQKYHLILKTTIISTVIIGAFWLFGKLGTGILYAEYSQLWDYRRLHPDFLPNTRTIRLIDMGHDTTYADLSWMKLIQFIGDNIGNGKYLDFTHAILVNITELHPFFVRAYEVDLLMAPTIYPDTDEKTLNIFKKKIEDILAHGEKGIKALCDEKKIEAIERFPIGSDLWKQDNLKNPCLSGMIPYYIAYHYSNDLHNGEKSEYFYKIASMQDDAPGASKLLGILAKSQEGNYLDSALSFLLVGTDGYDTEPFYCSQTVAATIAKGILDKRTVDTQWIKEIKQMESKLADTKDPKKPESFASTNCFDSTERGIKQLYIHHIAELASEFPDITEAQELVEKGIIESIPTIQSQSGFTIKKVNGVWVFRNSAH